MKSCEGLQTWMARVIELPQEPATRETGEGSGPQKGPSDGRLCVGLAFGACGSVGPIQAASGWTARGLLWGTEVAAGQNGRLDCMYE